MGFGRMLGLAGLGIAAVAAAPFTGGGSILAATGAAASLAGAGTIAAAAGAAAVGATAGAVLSSQEEEEERAKQRKIAEEERAKQIEIADANLKAEKATQVVKEHERHTDLIIALTALGVAMANADGNISEEEMRELNEFVGGLSSSAYPQTTINIIENLIKNPPTFNEAIKHLEKVDSVEYNEIRNILVLVMEADGKVENEEAGFLYAYDKKVQELTA